ncbi:hypothetical protein SO802_014865 [Lithocarpus litseifolius]|uniref:Uncharacterized protein n=1 Tax=Lithocarpus litseifolius TaxID=425828 RepID=A0AAW2CTF1_9ROSI
MRCGLCSFLIIKQQIALHLAVQCTVTCGTGRLCHINFKLPFFRKAYKNSKEEDMGSCLCFTYVHDLAPEPLDPNNIHQQLEIQPYGRGTFGPSDIALRARLPELNFPLPYTSSQTTVVGKWYSPFMFIRDGTLNNQMSTSMYYEMKLEQKWEQIFACENNDNQGNVVVVDVVLPREVISISGREVVDGNVAYGVMLFKSFNRGREIRVGLNLEVIERMKWEQERVGWVWGNDRQVSLKRVEEFERMGQWSKFGCYILVERFVLIKRMDGSLVLTYDFNHIDKIRNKWE